MPATIAPTAAWSGAIRLAKGSFGTVAVVFDSADHAHVVAVGRSAGKTGIWYLTDRSGTWTQKRILADPAGKAWRDRVDHRRRERPDHHRRLARLGRRPGGLRGHLHGERSRARSRHVPNGPHAYCGRACRDARPEDRRHPARDGVLSDLPEICCLPSLLFRTGSPGHWTTTTVAPDAAGPSLRLDARGRARIAYATNKDLRYASAGTTTGSFSVTSLPGTSSADYAVALALDSGDQPSLAWAHDAATDTIRYAAYDGSWPSPTTVAKAPVFTEVVGIGIDGSDVPHILAVGGSVREETLAGGTFVETVLATGVDALGGALRISASGREIVLWTADSGGLFMAERST